MLTGAIQGGAVALLVAVAIDAIFGEPPTRWHPVAWMGRALAATGAPWPSASRAGAFLRGAGAWTLGALVSIAVALVALQAIALVVQHAPQPWRWLLQSVLCGVLLKPLFALRMLQDEVMAVERATAISLAAGRQRLSGIVGRETALLTLSEVRESALESLAENLNDSFVAPLFWFVVGGLPAAALYRFANTADAMWGRRDRWEWAGKWSARADDVLSYVPARLTALLLSMAANCWPRHLWREAGRTESPNGGWPMAMMAIALDVRLGRPGFYVLHSEGRVVQAEDFHRGVRIAAFASRFAVAFAVIVLLFTQRSVVT
jgi:adenosylcobinamide-phosphate synthase